MTPTTMLLPRECQEIVAAFDAHPNKNNEEQNEKFYKNSYGVYNLPETLYYVGEFTRKLKHLYPNIQFSNTYTRCYNKDSFLGLHTDRDALDLTLSICVEDNGGYRWPLNVSKVPWIGGPWNDKTDHAVYKASFDSYGTGVGEGIFCEGKKFPHWRDPFDCKPNDRAIYTFYHWTLPKKNLVAPVEPANQRADVSFSLQNPNAYVIDNFLTAEECTALILASKDRLQKSTVVDNETGGSVGHSNRTSSGSFFQRGESELIRAIEARICDRVGIPLERGEPIQILKYGVGEEYKPHYDYFLPSNKGTPVHLKRGGQRVTTFLVYLNTPELGGATCFPDVGLEVGAKQGRALIFSYDKPDPSTKTLHGGMPVLRGEKWVITKWFREHNFV